MVAVAVVVAVVQDGGMLLMKYPGSGSGGWGGRWGVGVVLVVVGRF